MSKAFTGKAKITIRGKVISVRKEILKNGRVAYYRSGRRVTNTYQKNLINKAIKQQLSKPSRKTQVVSTSVSVTPTTQQPLPQQPKVKGREFTVFKAQGVTNSSLRFFSNETDVLGRQIWREGNKFDSLGFQFGGDVPLNALIKKVNDRLSVRYGKKVDFRQFFKKWGYSYTQGTEVKQGKNKIVNINRQVNRGDGF